MTSPEINQNSFDLRFNIARSIVDKLGNRPGVVHGRLSMSAEVPLGLIGNPLAVPGGDAAGMSWRQFIKHFKQLIFSDSLTCAAEF